MRCDYCYGPIDGRPLTIGDYVLHACCYDRVTTKARSSDNPGEWNRRCRTVTAAADSGSGHIVRKAIYES